MRRLIRCNICWTVQIVLLVGIVGWILLDPQAETTLHDARLLRTPTPIDSGGMADGAWRRVAILCPVVAFGMATLIVPVLGTLPLRGRVLKTASHRKRSVATLLIATTFAAGWLALAANWTEIAWQGKRARLAHRLDRFEALVGQLRDAWPGQDGDLVGVGPFMAYPFGEPSTLVLLNPPPLVECRLYVSAVQRDEGGAIKLELSGQEGGDWAEWHPSSSRPRSFVGGLQDRHTLKSATPLGEGWFLVRYKT